MKSFTKGQKVWVITETGIANDLFFEYYDDIHWEGIYYGLRDHINEPVLYLKELTFPTLREAQQYILLKKLS